MLAGTLSTLSAFSCTGMGKGHSRVEQLSRKITVDKSPSKRVVTFLGHEFSQPRVVPELASTKRVFVDWVHQTPELRVAVDRKPSILTASCESHGRGEEALQEFQSSGFQGPPSLAGNIRRPEAQRGRRPLERGYAVDGPCSCCSGVT